MYSYKPIEDYSYIPNTDGKHLVSKYIINHSDVYYKIGSPKIEYINGQLKLSWSFLSLDNGKDKTFTMYRLYGNTIGLYFRDRNNIPNHISIYHSDQFSDFAYLLTTADIQTLKNAYAHFSDIEKSIGLYSTSQHISTNSVYYQSKDPNIYQSIRSTYEGMYGSFSY